MKEKIVHVRLSNTDYNWLTQNATNVSFFIRNLIQEARRKDEEKPFDQRITETEKLLDEANKALEVSVRNAWSDTPELTGIINRQRKTVERLKAKLASLSVKT